MQPEDLVPIISSNVEWVGRHCPKLRSAAAAVMTGVQDLVCKYSCPRSDDDPMTVASAMGFGSLQAWTIAYLLTAAGHSSAGLAVLRRTVEFTCYAAKIRGSEKRALAWMDQRTDSRARRAFSLECSIPRDYTSTVLTHAAEAIREMRLELARTHYGDDVPPEYVRVIQEDDLAEIDRVFAGIVQREQQRRRDSSTEARQPSSQQERKSAPVLGVAPSQKA